MTNDRSPQPGGRHGPPRTRGRRPTGRRLAVTLSLACLAAAGVPLLSAQPAAASAALRVHAAARGKFIGTALATTPLANETPYRTIAAAEFNQVTAENAMKWDATEPTDNNYTWAGADQIVAFAQQNNQQVHGHTLVWHSQTPSWVQSLGATAMRTAMQDHISTVVGRYASNPAVVSWDVVNEAFNEDGTRRQSFWQNTLGDGYIADAFRFARAADSNARLCINDFNVEGINAKSTAMFNLVQSLRAQGVPVDCVGFQGHLGIQFGFPSQVQQNLQRFANLGVQVRFTEIDIRMILPRDSTKDATQATFYTNIVNACLAVTACAGITIWGFTDKYSWVPSTFSGQGAALIYDENYNAKPAYTAVHNALEGSPCNDTTPPSVPGTPVPSSVTSTTATLTWTASTDSGCSGLAGYNVYRRVGTTDTLLVQVSTNSANLTGLTAQTQYQVVVRARDNAGNLSGTSGVGSFTTGGGGSGSCSVTPTVQTQWQTGYVIEPARVTNTGTSTITSWAVTFTLPAGHTIVGFWRTALTVNGQTVTARNLSYNGTIAPAASDTFGFQVSRPNGNTALPTGYACVTPAP